jgi:hypothetical protein
MVTPKGSASGGVASGVSTVCHAGGISRRMKSMMCGMPATSSDGLT